MVHTLRMLATQKTTVIEKELQQLQIVTTQMTTQEKVVPQTAIDILHHRTSTHRLRCHHGHRLTQFKEATTQLLMQRRLQRPTPTVTHIHLLHVQQLTYHRYRYLEILGHSAQIGIELLGESQHGIALIYQVGTQRFQAVRALRRVFSKLGDDEIVQSTTLGVARSGQRQNVASQPVEQ